MELPTFHLAYFSQAANKKVKKQAGAELGQAQVQLS